MPKYLHIQVPTPCQQEWEQMQPVAGGNFCGSCQKTVIDFTGFTDNQLMEYFKHHSSGVCGRFYTEQLGQPLQIPVKKIPWLKYFFQVALPAMLISYKAQAQKLVKKNREPVEVVEKKPVVPYLQLPVTVSGRVIGFNGEPVANASIMIEGTNFGTAADSNGHFTLRLKENQRNLEISCVGYEKKLLTATGTDILVQLDIPLNDNFVVTATMVRRTSTYTGGATRIYTSSTIVKKQKEEKDTVVSVNPMRVFPNPVQKGGIITIGWNKQVNNKQRIVLYNASGSKLIEKTIDMKRDTRAQINLDKYAAGYYILLVTDCKSLEKQSATFVIE